MLAHVTFYCTDRDVPYHAPKGNIQSMGEIQPIRFASHVEAPPAGTIRLDVRLQAGRSHGTGTEELSQPW